jgi:hypothetical protein
VFVGVTLFVGVMVGVIVGVTVFVAVTVGVGVGVGHDVHNPVKSAIVPIVDLVLACLYEPPLYETKNVVLIAMVAIAVAVIVFALQKSLLLSKETPAIELPYEQAVIASTVL